MDSLRIQRPLKQFGLLHGCQRAARRHRDQTLWDDAAAETAENKQLKWLVANQSRHTDQPIGMIAAALLQPTKS